MRTSEFFRPGGIAGLALCFIAALAVTAHGVTEEIEVADLSGALRLEGETRPAANAEVHLEAFRMGADLSGLVVMRTKTDGRGRFTFRNVPVGFTRLRAYAPGYTLETALDLRKPRHDLDLALVWQGDRLSVQTNQPVYTPDEHPKLVLDGQTRRDHVTLSIFSFTEQEVFEKRDTYALTRAIAYNRQWEIKPQGPEPKPIQVIEHRLASQDVQGVFAETVELPKLAEGIYVVRAETDGAMRHHWINVSRIGLVTKVSPSGLIGFVVDIASGRPIGGVPVFAVGPNGRKDLGRTGPDGTVRSDGPGPSGAYVMVAAREGSRAFAMFDRWDDGDGRPQAVHVQTDRTIYRPGDTVFYKGFVRTPTADGYRLPDVANAAVRILDPNGTELSAVVLPVSSVGSFDGQFTTVNDVLGSYQVEVEIDGQVFTEWVPIAAYRKPEFEVTVTPVKPVYYVGEDVQFKVKAEFFTGEPVVGAALDAWATRSEIWDWSPFEEEEYEWWAYGEEYSYGGELVAELAGTTDENGEAVFTVRARGDGSSSADYQFRLSVTGADVSGRGFTGEGSVKVAQGAVDLDVAFEDYVVAPGSTVGVRLRGTLADGGAPAAGRRVTVEFGENVWTRDRVRDHRRGAHSVVLDERGEASLTLRPQNDGEFYARAVTKDDAGRTVRASDAIWVFSGAGSLPGPSHSLQIVLDKKRYAVGETATAVVRTDKPGGSVLVTVEAEGVLWSKVVALEGEATTVPIPVTDAVRPNASVRACYIREKSFAQSGRSLIVDMGRDVLSVEVTPNVSETLPGGAVSYTLTTRDADGDPVSADVSLSVVDEGVYAVREDTTDPLRSFFPNRWSQVGTYYSFPEVYLDGDDKSGMDVDVRTEFKDTAFWAPSVQTGDDGTATVGLVLPDNLTSWRATAVAVSDDARAGKGTANVLARKPVMVRASLPAFMVQDERQTIGVTVRNETDQDQRIEVSFMAHGLQVAGDASRRLDLKARSSGRAQWEVTALGPGEARVRVTAVASRGGHSDGLEQTFPLLTNGPTTQSFAAGDTDSSARFQMRLSPGAVSGELQISLAPTVLSGLVGSLDELVDYPYGCVEQTMSRFMPAVVVRQFLHELRIDRPDLDAKIVEVSKQSQARLASMQGSEGGFGWFLYDEGEPGMTALVLEGLYHAKQAGVDVEPHMRDRAIEWAKRYAAERPVLQRNAADDARLAYALSLHGVASNAWRRLLPDLRAVREDPRALAYVVLALAASKEGQTEQDAALRQSAYKALVELATVSETAASWEDGYWYEPTAVALLAVVKTDPDSPLAAKAMRYLMQKRRGRTWTSTRDTAQIIVAAISHLRGTKELEPAFEATVSVNGTASQTFAFDAQDLSRHELVRVPVARLKEGDNEVTVTFRGVGRVYWSAQLTQEVHDPRPRPTTSGDGLTVKREYFRMRGERLEDGTIRLVPSRSPVTSARQGEVLRCRITLTSDRERSYVLVRDPALSNARAIEPGDLQEWEWYYWWSDQSFFDDHTALFIDSLPKGEHVVEYSVRAEALGTGIALPATASLMYQPDVRATTGTYRLEVRP